MPTRFDEIKNQAAKVRQIKLVTVLQQIGAIAGILHILVNISLN